MARSPQGPPADPEDWSDEQWLEWLQATDGAAESGAPLPATTAGRIARSTGGQLLGTAMLAMSEVIYGRRDDEVVVVADGSGEGEDESVTVHLDPDHPERSWVAYRRRPSGPR